MSSPGGNGQQDGGRPPNGHGPGRPAQGLWNPGFEDPHRAPPQNGTPWAQAHAPRRGAIASATPWQRDDETAGTGATGHQVGANGVPGHGGQANAPASDPQRDALVQTAHLALSALQLNGTPAPVQPPVPGRQQASGPRGPRSPPPRVPSLRREEAFDFSLVQRRAPSSGASTARVDGFVLRPGLPGQNGVDQPGPGWTFRDGAWHPPSSGY